jgi:hypothetical protein
MSRHMPVHVQNGPISPRGEPKASFRVILAIGAASALVLSLILATWQHVEALRYGYRLNQLARERERLEALKRQLESERAYYRSPQVIEPLARRLGLIRPDPSHVIVVGRGGASAAGDLRAPLPGNDEHASERRAAAAAPSMAQPEVPTARRRGRAKPVKPAGQVAGEGTSAPSGPHAEVPAASESPENANGLSPKGTRLDDAPSTGERPSAAPSENSTPKRRRPSKQGEP